jgi:hypothetical protein
MRMTIRVPDGAVGVEQRFFPGFDMPKAVWVGV